MTWTVPNILTIVRLAAAPAVMLVFLVVPRPFADWAAMLLFIGASVTDWIDGHLARRWNQQTKLGTMLDPIADKAVVIIALAAVIALKGMNPLVMLPATIILFREVFVSGLREFLGDTAGTLKVTRLAKWKTTIQMVAIAALLINGAYEYQVGLLVAGLDPEQAADAITGGAESVAGLPSATRWMVLTWYFGVISLWLAALLTFVTGWDYFTKASPYLKD